VFLLARRLTGDLEGGYLACLTFLGFRSTFQYGRPFLTNMPESLFVFVCLFMLIYFRHKIGASLLYFGLLLGLPLGVACLFKSFVLVVPVGLALAWLLLSERRWDIAAFARTDVPKIALTVVVALSCFALWPLLDPDPSSVMQRFVLEENMGKLGASNYLSGLVTGPYPVYRIWVAPLASAGLFGLPLLLIAVRTWPQRARLSFEEKALWIFALSFLLVYTFPSQRQENYLLPVMPALAVLLGLHWTKINRRWHYLFLLPALLVLMVLVRLMLDITAAGILSPFGYTWWQLGAPILALLVWAAAFLRNRLAPCSFHLVGFMLFLSLTCGLAPFDGPAGRFDPERVARLKGKTVHVPEGFVSKHTRHRFLLPGVHIEGYDPADMGHLSQLLASREYVVVHRPLGEPVAGPYRTFARRLDLRTRQTAAEIRRLILHKDLDVFIQQELIVRRRTAKRERGEVTSRQHVLENLR
jgi:4-amino-4-deoxy-L-arabinose transferase-like glycosyltransferase